MTPQISNAPVRCAPLAVILDNQTRPQNRERSMTRISKRLSYTLVVLIGVSAVPITGAASAALIAGEAPPVLHIKPDCEQHPWDISCVRENPERQFNTPATCKALGLEPPKPGMVACLFQ